jgi:glycosyltransferase involved in cell wall biosynthesis
MLVGYLIPEFPGQTHVWMWREIVHMRESGVSITIFSTRRPPERDWARHSFADAATRETVYLLPWNLGKWFGATLWAIVTRPMEFMRCVTMAATLPVHKRPAWKTVLPLIVPACVLARELKHRKIEHLHSHSCANSALLAMMVKRLTGIGYSMTLNANIEWWGGAMAEKFGEADFTIAITEWLLAQVRRDYPQLRSNQVLLGRIGVDTRKWVPDRTWDAAGETLRIITVGRLHPSKGHDHLIRAVAQMTMAGRKVSLRLFGDGPQRRELESLANGLGVARMVKFEGSVSEDRIIEEMRKSDVFVLASHSEPLGVVYMEAMSMEVATIGTAAGGVAEIITNGVDGLLVEPKNVQALVSAISKLQDDPELRLRLARGGRQTIINKFDSRIGANTLLERLGVDRSRSSANRRNSLVRRRRA